MIKLADNRLKSRAKTVLKMETKYAPKNSSNFGSLVSLFEFDKVYKFNLSCTTFFQFKMFASGRVFSVSLWPVFEADYQSMQRTCEL